MHTPLHVCITRQSPARCHTCRPHCTHTYTPFPPLLQVAGGLLSEALMLLDQGMAPNSNIATRAIGYRQACEFMKVREGGGVEGA